MSYLDGIKIAYSRTKGVRHQAVVLVASAASGIALMACGTTTGAPQSAGHRTHLVSTAGKGHGTQHAQGSQASSPRRIPDGVTEIVVTYSHNAFAGSNGPGYHTTVEVTQPGKIRQIEELFDSLKVATSFPPCAMDLDAHMVLSFYGGGDSMAPIAVVDAHTGGCQVITLTEGSYTGPLLTGDFIRPAAGIVGIRGTWLPE
ncbi:MAG TPA: hypothetical protein VGS21_03675 [Acidimicrobiales bacterium]|nr:hypothetical protein [Acidimicrobiales bacterium]